MLFLNICIFILSCGALAFAGNLLVRSLARIADFLGWKEFTVSFFVMSAATALPEFFVGISSALQGVPELSFGNIIGQSIIHFTLAVGVCVLISKSFTIDSPVIRASAWYSGIMAVLPIALIADKELSRADGAILFVSFILYSIWLFSKRESFEGEYTLREKDTRSLFKRFASLMKDVGIFVSGVAIIIVASQGIIVSTISFVDTLGFPLVVIGALIVGMGTSLPEIYFSAFAARKNHAGFMLGNLLGSTAMSVSMVLGAVAMIHPISVPDMSPYLISRAFLITAVVFFIIFMSTGKRITKREGIFLAGLYVLFVLSEIIVSLTIV